jgi:hypothetical protein
MHSPMCILSRLWRVGKGEVGLKALEKIGRMVLRQGTARLIKGFGQGLSLIVPTVGHSRLAILVQFGEGSLVAVAYFLSLSALFLSNMVRC